MFLVWVDYFLRKAVPALSGISSNFPEVPLIAIGPQADALLIEQCCSAGAWAYLPFETSAAELLAIAEELAREGRSIPPLVPMGLAAEVAVPSQRELEVLRHVAMGADNLKIAALLSISERTVKSHIHSLFRKLNVENRVELALQAERWCAPEPPVFTSQARS